MKARQGKAKEMRGEKTNSVYNLHIHIHNTDTQFTYTLIKYLIFQEGITSA